ncbi:MAG: endonuclease III [bacterium]
MNKKTIIELIKRLKKEYPDAKTELNYSTPFELLVATILSAQTTDKQVNKVTAELFKKYNKPEDFANLKTSILEKEINSIGLYKNKSRFLIESSKIIISEYNGDVPENRKDLMSLPGVGRKTANVLLACVFNKNAIAVDTHVFRLANRLGFANTDNVREVEESLMEKIPEKLWADMHHYLIYHGRRVCKARNPLCNQCILIDLCEY